MTNIRSLTKKGLELQQKELYQEILDKTGINTVTCGMCGSVNFHKIEEEEIKCSSCEFHSEPCDFPDFYY